MEKAYVFFEVFLGLILFLGLIIFQVGIVIINFNNALFFIGLLFLCASYDIFRYNEKLDLNKVGLRIFFIERDFSKLSGRFAYVLSRLGLSFIFLSIL